MRCRIVVAACLPLVLGGCATAGARSGQDVDSAATSPAAATTPLVRYLSPETHFDTPAFSQVAITEARGRTYYVSGQIPVNAQYELIGADDLRQQTKAVLSNLDSALTAAAITKNDVVKINIALVSTQATDSFLVSEEILAYFQREEMPASTMISVPYIVADGILVQIDAIAVKE